MRFRVYAPLRHLLALCDVIVESFARRAAMLMPAWLSVARYRDAVRRTGSIMFIQTQGLATEMRFVARVALCLFRHRAWLVLPYNPRHHIIYRGCASHFISAAVGSTNTIWVLLSLRR